MARLATDENFNHDIVRGVRRKRPAIDLVTAVEAGLSRATDPVVLEWAAREGRILLTHDVSTMTKYAYERAAAGLPMPGVFQVRRGLVMTELIDDIILLTEARQEGEWEGQVNFLPL